MVFLSLRLGRRASRGPLYGIALYFFLFAPAARRHLAALSAAGAGPGARRRPTASVKSFISPPPFTIASISSKRQFERFDITIEGEALMRAQLESGRGALLMGAHMGSFEVHPQPRPAAGGDREWPWPCTRTMRARSTPSSPPSIRQAWPTSSPSAEIDAMLHIAERLIDGALRRRARRPHA